MYQIKAIPEDFIVKEISSVDAAENGQHAYFLLRKVNYTTVGALEMLSKKSGIPLKYFGFAGNKDKNAITEQKISVFRGSKKLENVEANNIQLQYLGNGKNPISLGDLDGNEFTITIRNLDEKHIKKIKSAENKKTRVPNLYGPQRFSINNHLVGKSIIKRDFKKVIGLILENGGFAEEKIRQFIESNRNNYIEALRLIPLKTRKLYVHSYQSFLFNKTASDYLKNYKNKPIKNVKIPVIGFNFEINETTDVKLRRAIKKILEEERITPRDFITSQVPELASEGGFRDLFFETEDLKILEAGKDELNENKEKIRISFTLPKSCYATIFLEFLLQ